MEPGPQRRPELPNSPIYAEQFNVMMTEWIDASTAYEAQICERSIFGSIASVRAPLDFLMCRAHHEVRRVDASHAVAHELLRRTAESMATVADQLDRFEGDDPSALELFNEELHAALTDMFRVLGGDAAVGELGVIEQLLDSPRAREAVLEVPVSSVTLITVMLADGRSYAARERLFEEPLVAPRDKVVRVTMMLTEQEWRSALEAQARLLTALRRQMPMDRWRAMVCRPERGGDRRDARPGLGFVDVADLAAWSKNSVRSLRAKISRTMTSCASAYADVTAPIVWATGTAQPTTAWIDNALEGQ